MSGASDIVGEPPDRQGIEAALASIRVSATTLEWMGPQTDGWRQIVVTPLATGILLVTCVDRPLCEGCEVVTAGYFLRSTEDVIIDTDGGVLFHSLSSRAVIVGDAAAWFRENLVHFFALAARRTTIGRETIEQARSSPSAA